MSNADRAPPLNAFASQYVHERFELASIEGALKFRPRSEDLIYRWATTKRDLLGHREGGKDKLYKPLIDPFEIRLLEIKPGVHSDKLQGSLHHCSVEFEEGDAPAKYSRIPTSFVTRYALSLDDLQTPILYTALSYTWGAPVFDGSIECDGHAKAITKSLETALRTFRDKQRSVVMWIDQICINQADHTEKEQQIPLMGRIYKHAWNTVLWLGEASPGSDSAMQLVEDANISLQFALDDISPADFERVGLPSPNSEVWHALWDLLLRPWFSRLWIVQEVMLSLNPWVVCGETLITWDTLGNGCNNLSTCGIFRWLQQRFWDGSKAMANANENLCQVALDLSFTKSRHDSFIDGNTLFSLLVETRHAQCYDQRDRVYGLLGVCATRNRHAVRTNYAENFTAAELYHQITIHHLADNPGGLRLTTVLSSVDHDSPGLPSWVPDWRIPRQTTALGYSSSAQSIYNPTGRPQISGKKYSAFNEKDKNELHLRGIFVDTLAQTSEPFSDPDLTHINPSTLNTTLLESWKFASQFQRYPSPNTVFSAYCHTLVAGKDATGRLKYPPSFTEIISLLLDESTGKSPSLPGQIYSPRQQRPAGKGRLELASLASRTAGKTFLEVRTAMKAAMKHRRLGITTKGYLGLFPAHCEAGDAVYVLDGCHMPFLLRGMDRLGRFRLVGECYVFGIMDGEVVEREDVTMEGVTLV